MPSRTILFLKSFPSPFEVICCELLCCLLAEIFLQIINLPNYPVVVKECTSLELQKAMNLRIWRRHLATSDSDHRIDRLQVILPALVPSDTIGCLSGLVLLKSEDMLVGVSIKSGVTYSLGLGFCHDLDARPRGLSLIFHEDFYIRVLPLCASTHTSYR
jgi:hypothetical protein